MYVCLKTLSFMRNWIVSQANFSEAFIINDRKDFVRDISRTNFNMDNAQSSSCTLTLLSGLPERSLWDCCNRIYRKYCSKLCMWGKRSSRTLMDMKSPARCKVRVSSRNRVGYPWMITLISPKLSTFFLVGDEEVFDKVRLSCKNCEECSDMLIKLLSLEIVPLVFNSPNLKVIFKIIYMHTRVYEEGRPNLWQDWSNAFQVNEQSMQHWRLVFGSLSPATNYAAQDTTDYRRPNTKQNSG